MVQCGEEASQSRDLNLGGRKHQIQSGRLRSGELMLGGSNQTWRLFGEVHSGWGLADREWSSKCGGWTIRQISAPLWRPTCRSVWTLSLVAQCLGTWTTSFEDKSRDQPWGLGLGSRCLLLGDHSGPAPPTPAFQLGTSDWGTPECSVCVLRQSPQPGSSPWGLTPEPPGGPFGLESPFWDFN